VKKNVDQMKKHQAQNLILSLFLFDVQILKIVLVASQLDYLSGKKC